MVGVGEASAITVLLLSAAAAGAIIWRGRIRTVCDVADDLVAPGPLCRVQPQSGRAGIETAAGRQLADKLEGAGLFNRDQQQRFSLQQQLMPLGGAGLAVTGLLLSSSPAPMAVLLSTVSGLAAGYLAAQQRLKMRQHGFRRRIEFFLPIVMERIVMAVQSGLDVLPAIKAIVEIEHKWVQGLPDDGVDPVTALLEQVYASAEAGVGFDQSLHSVAARIKSSALRHAFIHLGVAQREGGELVMPLKELSDATQLCYQESVEEELAKMPVKATLPLLCTFAGLILCFLTAPLVQVITIAAKPVLP